MLIEKRVSRHLETIKALGLWPGAFICFSVSGYPGQTLAIVFDILLLHARDVHEAESHPPGYLINSSCKVSKVLLMRNSFCVAFSFSFCFLLIRSDLWLSLVSLSF